VERPLPVRRPQRPHRLPQLLHEPRISFQLNRVYTLTDEQRGGFTFERSDAQRSAVLTAAEDGYFEVPRRTTLGEIGEKLGITEQSASETLRRGVDQVLSKTLLHRAISDYR
jgi:predicted DNA binding protein